MSGKNILVTGGSGFIGSNLCEHLLSLGHSVICLDNEYSSSRKNIAHLLANKKFRFVSHNIIDPLTCTETIDEIYNLACPASPPHYQRDPIFTTKTSVLGMLNVLQFAEEKGAKVLQASTSEVYGDPLEHPQKESYFGNVNPCSIRACYDEGKRVAESLCMDFGRRGKISPKIIRIFNTYGPGMDPQDGRVVSNFIIQALRGEPITIYGDGRQTRSFQYVSDLVLGIVAMMDVEDFVGPVNLGNPDEYTVGNLAEKIVALTGSHSKIVYKDLPEADPQKRKPDISLAREKLGWTPVIGLEEGLQKTIAYFQGSM